MGYFLAPIRSASVRSADSDRRIEHAFSFLLIGCIKDIADGLGHFRAQGLLGHVSLGISLQMALTPLPGHRRQGGLAGLLEAGMVVTDDQRYAM